MILRYATMIDSLAIAVRFASVRYRPAFQTRRSLERWQKQRFKRFAHRVLARSPFYRRYVGSPLEEYPIVDKTVTTDAFDQINTHGLSRDLLMALALRAETTRDFAPMYHSFAVGLSSGTSGQRGLFVTSRRERQLYVGTILAKGLPGTILQRHRIALLLRANNQLYEAANTSRIAYAFFDLKLPFAEVLDDLQAYRPTILIGPPQTLRLVAEAQMSGSVQLTLRKILAGGEVLETSDARVIENAFGVGIAQMYQAAEGFLGISCAHGTLHLNEDFIIFERQWVDRAARCFIPIVTDFTRSTQPIVRYKLDDVLVERKHPCTCGSIHVGLDRIQGRADDILFLPRAADGQLAPVLPDFVRDALGLNHPTLRDYRVVQLSPTCVALTVVGTGPEYGVVWALAADALKRVFSELNVRQPILREGEPIVNDLARKVRRVERRFPVDGCRT
jgi:putative adenylate-forming enzyme